MTLREIERRVILTCLRRDPYLPRISQHLGIGLKTLYNKLRAYHLWDEYHRLRAERDSRKPVRTPKC